VTTENASTTAAEPAPSVTLRRGRLTAVITAGIAAVIIAIGVGSVLFIVKNTPPDRNTPEAVIRQFLQAGLVEHDVARAQSFTCDGRRAAEIVSKFNNSPLVSVSWGVSSLDVSDPTAEAMVEVDFNYKEHIDPQQWRFELMRQNGDWRVCDANRT
jgi:hypothetical protein